MTKNTRRAGRPAGAAKYTMAGTYGQVAATGYKRLTFFTPAETANRLKAAAALAGIPTSELLNRAIESYLKTVRGKI